MKRATRWWINQTDGKPVCWEGLFTKWTRSFQRRKSFDKAAPMGRGAEGSEPGLTFGFNIQGILCWHCSGQGLQVAKRTSGAKRPLILEGASSSARVKRARGTLLAPAIKAPEGPKVRITRVGLYDSKKWQPFATFAVQSAMASSS